jgi:hypothetical protein
MRRCYHLPTDIAVPGGLSAPDQRPLRATITAAITAAVRAAAPGQTAPPPAGTWPQAREQVTGTARDIYAIPSYGAGGDKVGILSADALPTAPAAPTAKATPAAADAPSAYRQKAGTQTEPALPALQDTDPALSPRYIDMLFESVTPPSMINGAITFFWEEGGAKKKITIPLKDLVEEQNQVFVGLWRIHRSKDEALKTVELYRKAAPGYEYFSFYIRDGAIMPTSFSAGSTPQFHVLWPDLKRMNAEIADDIHEGFRQLAGAINPIPCTELDEHGNLRPVLNFTNCVLPLALHAYAIHSVRGPRVPPSEPSTQPGMAPTPPKPPVTAESSRPPAPAEPVKTEPVKTEPAKTEAEPVSVRSPAELERYLEQLGLASDEIRGLAGGRRRGQFSRARAGLIERLLKHFTPADLKALGKFLGERRIRLDGASVDALIKGVDPGGASDWIRRISIAEVHGDQTRLPEVEGAKEESLGEEQDPGGRMTTKKRPSSGPEPRSFLRGNFAHRFAEYLLDALRLPRPSRAEVVIELRDGTGDIIRTDRIVSHEDHGDLLEIKPAGTTVGEGYLRAREAALQREFPKPSGWTGRIVEYSPADVRAWLRAEARAARAAGLPVPDIEGIMKLLGF